MSKLRRRQTKRKYRGGSQNNNNNLAEALRLSLSQSGEGLATMPPLCFGTRDTNLILKKALKIGYRHIDGADNYEYIFKKNYTKNLANTLATCGIPRNQLWITWKGDITDLDFMQKKINQIGCQYYDLYLIHHGCGTDYHFKNLQAAQKAGLIRFYGVSNCEDLETITYLKKKYNIYANQIQARPPGGIIQGHPLLDPLFIEKCNSLGVHVMLFSPVSAIGNTIGQIIRESVSKQTKPPDIVYMLDKLYPLISKYYIQKYINQDNKNVLMVSSLNPNSSSLEENLTDVNTILAGEPLLSESQMSAIQNILQKTIIVDLVDMDFDLYSGLHLKLYSKNYKEELLKYAANE